MQYKQQAKHKPNILHNYYGGTPGRTISFPLQTVTIPQPAHNSVIHCNPIPVRRSIPIPKSKSQNPFLSHAAVTAIKISNSGLQTSIPSPAVLLRDQIHNRRRLSELPEPSPLALKTIRLCIKHLLAAEQRDDLYSHELLSLVSKIRKPGTLNTYALAFATWHSFANRRHNMTIPIQPLEFATFLISAAQNDRTISPTLNRCNAASFFSSLAGTQNPVAHPLCKHVKEALYRELGLAGNRKLPLLQSQVQQILTYQLSSNHNLQTLLTCFRIALMYEGCMRWSDMLQIEFGDIIITHQYLRIFIQSAKTDSHREGQWATIATSAETTSAYNLLLHVLEALAYLWSRASNDLKQALVASIHVNEQSHEAVTMIPTALPLTHIPISFKINHKTLIPDFRCKITYPSFLSTIRLWASRVGIQPESIGTHSLRRGLASTWALIGIPDRLRQIQGRWKSSRVADGYIDESINIHLQLQAMQYASHRTEDLIPPRFQPPSSTCNALPETLPLVSSPFTIRRHSEKLPTIRRSKRPRKPKQFDT